MHLCNHINRCADLSEESINAHAGAQEEWNYHSNTSLWLLSPFTAAASILEFCLPHAAQPPQELRSDPAAGEKPLTGRAINQRRELLNPLLVLSVS